jgi:hypothetical protein
MAKHTAALLEGLVGMIRGPANPKSEGARRKVHSQLQPCLKWEVRQGRRGGKDRCVWTGKIQFDVVRKEFVISVVWTWVRKECDMRCWSAVSMDTESCREGNDSGTGNPRRGVRLKIQSHTQPCLELEERQGRRGGKVHDVWTGKIYIIVVRKECEISVSHLYKWALRVVERWSV